MIDPATREEVRRVVGENIARLRKDKGWSQDDLGKRVGISYVQISRLENGMHSPSSEVLFALADVFGVKADDLRQIPVLGP